MEDPFKVDNYGAMKPAILTFSHGGLLEIDIGKPVKMNGNNSVTLAAADEEVFGYLETVKKDVCGVQLLGIVRAKYTEADPAVGFGTFFTDGAGSIKTGASTIKRRILDVDATNKEVTFIL